MGEVCNLCKNPTDQTRLECCAEYYCTECAVFCVECQSQICPQCHSRPQQVCPIDSEECRNYLRPLCTSCIKSAPKICQCLSPPNTRSETPTCQECRKSIYYGLDYHHLDASQFCTCEYLECEQCGILGLEDVDEVDWCHCCRCSYCARCADWKTFDFYDHWVRNFKHTARVATCCLDDGSAFDRYDMANVLADKLITKPQLSALKPWLKI